MAIVRLDKYLADAGLGTRSQVKELIKKRRVKVDDNIIMSSDVKICTDINIVTVDNAPVEHSEFRYYVLHKPSGCVTATTDNHDKTVMDYLEGENIKGLFPVGRLDKDTEGLLIITNDGELSHNLLSPKKHVDKTYFVITDVDISEEMLEKLENGIDIGDDTLTKHATAKYNNGKKNETLLTISEGRFHQVKRMYKALGAEVIYLKRLSMGSLVLDESLGKGQYRKLTEKEISDLKNEKDYKQ